MHDATTLRKELGGLCRGRGLTGAPLDSLGPALTARMRDAGLTDEQRRSRAEVTGWFRAWTGRLPTDLRAAARAALGIHPDAQHRFLQGRTLWLADTLGRDERTARRRVDEALTLLAQTLAEHGPAVPATGTGPPTGHRWYFASVRALVRLDGPAPEVTEERRFVAVEPTLERLSVEVSVPRGPRGGTRLTAEALYGGMLTAALRPSESLHRFEFAPSRPLRTGDHHDLVIRYTFPQGHRLPHYAYTPLSQCDHFHLRLRFPAVPDVRVWRLDGVPPRILDDPPPAREADRPDAAFGAAAEFHRLELGHAYGFRWHIPSSDSPAGLE